MKMMGHDAFIIHQRRAKFPSDRHDWHRLPVEGSAAFEGRKRNALADMVGQMALFVAFATLTYMLGRIAYSAIFGG